MVTRWRYRIEGQVQGVGFRPFVYRLAHQVGVGGSIRNDSRGVVIDVQGDDDRLARFERGLATQLPPLAVISRLERTDSPV